MNRKRRVTNVDRPVGHQRKSHHGENDSGDGSVVCSESPHQ